jgi:hypothetical protein
LGIDVHEGLGGEEKETQREGNAMTCCLDRTARHSREETTQRFSRWKDGRHQPKARSAASLAELDALDLRQEILRRATTELANDWYENPKRGLGRLLELLLGRIAGAADP